MTYERPGLERSCSSRLWISELQRAFNVVVGAPVVMSCNADHACQRLVPTFRSTCYISAGTFHVLRKVMGTSKSLILVPLFYLTFPSRIRRGWCRNVKWAALVCSYASCNIVPV